MGMIDQQNKDTKLKEALKENENLKKEIKLLEKLIELNIKDFHNVVEQRDQNYNKYKKLKIKFLKLKKNNNRV